MSVDLGASGTVGEITLSNTGGTAVAWALDAGTAAPFTPAATGASLAPGESVAVQFFLDRSSAAEGTLGRAVAITSTGSGGGNVELRATVDRNPQVTITQAAPNPTCPAIEVPTIVASVVDESPIVSVQLSWSGPDAPGSTAMQPSGGGWTGGLGVPYVEGAWTYVVTATDSRGNVGIAQAVTTVACPIPG
jgi:hypothetical protein